MKNSFPSPLSRRIFLAISAAIPAAIAAQVSLTGSAAVPATPEPVVTKNHPPVS